MWSRAILEACTADWEVRGNDCTCSKSEEILLTMISISPRSCDASDSASM